MSTQLHYRHHDCHLAETSGVENILANHINLTFSDRLDAYLAGLYKLPTSKHQIPLFRA